jgi:hypothetical protein
MSSQIATTDANETDTEKLKVLKEALDTNRSLLAAIEDAQDRLNKALQRNAFQMVISKKCQTRCQTRK